jgi:gliding motility-associated-like protein
LIIIKQIVFNVAFCTIFISFSKGQSPTELGAVCAESREFYGVDGYDDSEFIWVLEGGIIVSGDGEDTIEVQWGYDVGNFNIQVVEITSSGCEGLPSIANVEVSAPLVYLGADFIEVCEPDSLVLDARGNYIEPYLMQWHDGTYSPRYIAKETEEIWVKVTDGMGCERYDTIEFEVHPLPVVDLGNDTLLCDEENPLVLNAGDYASYEWSTSSGQYFTDNPYYAFPVKPVMDTLRVTVTDIHGCEMSDTITIYPCDIVSLFDDMPNTFTPDDSPGDGGDANDVWNIPYIEQFPKAVLEIFDRWGRLVYRTENVYEEPWDGMSKGRPMPMDSYFFVLELNYMNVESISGTINLIR